MSKISISREESLEKMIQMPWRSMVNIYIWRINGLDMYWKKCNGQNAREQQEQSNHHLNFKEQFTFQRATSTTVLKHDTSLSLVLNLDQTPLSYVSRERALLVLKV